MRATLRARDDILLTGYRPDARALLARADLCVAPSTVAEAFCLSVLEPMALGKPVVAFAVGAIPELIEDGVTGSLVPRGDEGALTRAIDDLLRDPARRARLGSAARIRATKDFTPAEQLRRLTALVERGFQDPCAASSA
jgi:glycosyltransferase involved in cell wall biosynthesis